MRLTDYFNRNHKNWASQRSATRRFQLQLEWLEGRCLLSTFTVTSALDDGSVGTLRWAINQANGNPGTDTINFQIGNAGATIQPTTALPIITDPVVID